MSATVEISETNGASPGTTTDGVSNINFGSVDSPNLDSNTDTLTAPGNSYEKWERFHITSMGGAIQVDNFRVYFSNIGGGYAQGESVYCNLTPTGYSAATYPVAGPTNATSSVATLVMPLVPPGSSNIGIGGSLSGNFTAAPGYTDYFVLQMQLQANVPQGALQQIILSYSWDEQ